MMRNFFQRVVNKISFIIRNERRKRKGKKFIFSDPNRPIKKKVVNLHYWKFYDGSENVGDFFSKMIVEKLLSSRKILVDQKIPKTCHLMAIGSILNYAKHDTVIWGSGIHNYNSRIPKVNFDIRCIRGPVTQGILLEHGINCPNIFGDPAILLPDFYHPSVEKSKDFLIIPHYSKENRYLGKYEHVISTLTSDWKGFVKSILSAHLVISSSLHGIIIAEAYGIPAVLLDDIDHDYLKYNDYYFSTGRYNYSKVSTVEEALVTIPEKLPDFSLMKSNLYNSFPYDLWNSEKIINS